MHCNVWFLRGIFLCVAWLCSSGCTEVKCRQSTVGVNQSKSQGESRERLVQEAREVLRAQGVASYPLFENCDETHDRHLQQVCFESTLSYEILARLRPDSLRLSNAISDTLWLPIEVDNQGVVGCGDIVVPLVLVEQVPDLEARLRSCIGRLPVLSPAHIQGVAIATRYRLPVVIKLKDQEPGP